MSDLKLINEYGGAVRRFAIVPSVEGGERFDAAKGALLRHCEAKDKRIAELGAQLKLLREIESQHALLQKLTHAEAQVKALEVGLCAMSQSAAGFDKGQTNE